jgi:NhaA family Na+:H+ antiporter
MMSADRLTSLATGVLACCAVAVTAVLVRHEFAPPVRTNSGAAVPVAQPDWAQYATAGHSPGPLDAKVTIVEFGDFECPYCRRFSVLADSLRWRGKSFRVVYRHFPLTSHRFALPAVRVSECASQQGKFDEMYAALYSHPDSLGLAPWSWFGHQAHIPDSVRFATCVRDTKPIAGLARDTVDGNRLGVTGTPTLLIGNLRVSGVPSFDSLSAYIDRAARAKQK